MRMWIVLFVCLVGVCLSGEKVFADEGDDDAIRDCLKSWGNAPFEAKEPHYRTLTTKVKVIGIGGDTEDKATTAKPDLVLVKAGVAVMSKISYELQNPNGWYCLKGKVAVMGKVEININCKAKLASSGDGVGVLGATDSNSGGVAVMGAVRLNRQCD